MRAGGVASRRARVCGRRRGPMLPYYALSGRRSAGRGASPRCRLARRPCRRRAARHRARHFDALRDNLRHVLPGIGDRPTEAPGAPQRPPPHALLGRRHGDVVATDRPAVADRHRPLPLQGRARARQRRGGGVDALRLLGGGTGGLEQMGHKIALLAEELRPKKLFDAFAGARGAPGVQIIPIDTQAMREGDAQFSRRIGAAVDARGVQGAPAGGVVAMALDRDLIGNGDGSSSSAQPAPIPIGSSRSPCAPGRRSSRSCSSATGTGSNAVVIPEISLLPRCAAGCRGAQDWQMLRDLRGGDPRASRAMARPRSHLAGGRGAMKICLVSPYDFMHPGGVTEHVRHLVRRAAGTRPRCDGPGAVERVGDDHGIPGYVRIGRSVPVQNNGSVARIALCFHLVAAVARCSTTAISTSCTTTSRWCRPCRSRS